MGVEMVDAPFLNDEELEQLERYLRVRSVHRDWWYTQAEDLMSASPYKEIVLEFYDTEASPDGYVPVAFKGKDGVIRHTEIEAPHEDGWGFRPTLPNLRKHFKEQINRDEREVEVFLKQLEWKHLLKSSFDISGVSLSGGAHPAENIIVYELEPFAYLYAKLILSNPKIESAYLDMRDEFLARFGSAS